MEIVHKSVLDEMTDEQREILKKFRESLDVELNHRHTDELLVKFLRAKNFHLKEAKKVFMENYYNRITFGLNNILETYQKPEVAEKFETTSTIGFAKDGTLIRYIAAGRLDFYGFIMSMSCYELCLYFSHVMEQDAHMLEVESSKTGKNLTEMTFIIDLEGFTLQQVLHQCVVEMGLDYMRLIQDCYPEIWRNVIVVNAPKIFHTAFNLFKPVLRPTVRDKLNILDKAHSKSVLLQYVDEDVLPAFLGGNRVDSKGDPMCKEFVTFGGAVPEKFFSAHHRVPLSPDDPGVKIVNIGPRSTFNLTVIVREVGSLLRLQARTEKGSLNVSVLYREFGRDPEHPELPGDFEELNENDEDSPYTQISVELRGQMHCTQEDAKIITHRPGIHILRLKKQRQLVHVEKTLLQSDGDAASIKHP